MRIRCRSVAYPRRRLLLAGDLLAELNGHQPEDMIRQHYATAPADDPLAGMIAADVNTFLPDDFLTKVDRASMSCGLEVRPPLVDHELLELAARIPSQYKIRRGEKKWIFKQVFQDRLPRGWPNARSRVLKYRSTPGCADRCARCLSRPSSRLVVAFPC